MGITKKNKKNKKRSKRTKTTQRERRVEHNLDEEVGIRILSEEGAIAAMIQLRE